tara:strand:- start:675 stop:1211 length:537 start_codon:yes stop_codon:yes gene_type:complete
MPLTVKITDEQASGRPTERILLKARKTIDGNVFVTDHPEIDIVLMKEKVVALPKDELDDEIYETQNRLFKFLTKKGIVAYDSIQAGNLFMSLEAKLPIAMKGDSVQYALYVISEFMDKELPFYANKDRFEKEVEANMLKPEPDEYTDLDKAMDLHNDKKGNLNNPKLHHYGISAVYRI